MASCLCHQSPGSLKTVLTGGKEMGSELESGGGCLWRLRVSQEPVIMTCLLKTLNLLPDLGK